MTLWRQAILPGPPLSVRLPPLSSLSRLFPAFLFYFWIITHHPCLALESLISGAEMDDLSAAGKRSFEWSERGDAPHLLMWCNCSSSERCNSIAVYSGWMPGRGGMKMCCSETVGWNRKPGVCYTGWKWVMEKLHENCLFSDGIYPRKVDWDISRSWSVSDTTVWGALRRIRANKGSFLLDYFVCFFCLPAQLHSDSVFRDKHLLLLILLEHKSMSTNWTQLLPVFYCQLAPFRTCQFRYKHFLFALYSWMHRQVQKKTWKPDDSWAFFGDIRIYNTHTHKRDCLDFWQDVRTCLWYKIKGFFLARRQDSSSCVSGVNQVFLTGCLGVFSCAYGNRTQHFKPICNLFLTLTRWFLCLNQTRA